MELTDEQRRAYARELASNPILEEILTDLRDTQMVNWEQSGSGDVGKREEAWLSIQTLNSFRAAIKDTLTKLDE